MRDIWFGTREEFDYFRCADCGCLQIASIPEDMGRYYPDEYDAFKPLKNTDDRLKRLYKSRWLAHLRGQRNVLGALLSLLKEPPFYFGWFLPLDITGQDPILDVGCGTGNYLNKTWQCGFDDLTGIDPFIPHDLDYPNGVRIRKGFFSDTDRRFALVTLHHSLEHMPDQHQSMAGVAKAMRPGGWALVRVPVCDSWAFDEFGRDWGHIDAPRHLYLHTTKSIEKLAHKNGLELVHEYRDSDHYQFTRSLAARRDIAFNTEEFDALFSKEEKRDFKKKARELNREGRGDTACFYLKKK